MQVGQKYRGYGLLNEFGEFEFTPEQTGSRQGVVKMVKSGENYTLSTTKKCVVIHINLDRSDKPLVLIRGLMQVVNELLIDFRTYEF